ncbi:hypothetical protein ACFSY7_08255 [Kurthia populi]|uniref:Uncharacterized protein n=1 Tax=Kurthia populi TaxID=1562132 RepID=A0ABW5Y0G2_9BACL
MSLYKEVVKDIKYQPNLEVYLRVFGIKVGQEYDLLEFTLWIKNEVSEFVQQVLNRNEQLMKVKRDNFIEWLCEKYEITSDVQQEQLSLFS